MAPRQQVRRPFLAWCADAWWFVRFAAIDPVRRFQPVFRGVITTLGISIAVAVQWIGGPVPTTIVILVGVILLLIVGGARLVRSDIALGDIQVDGREMRLDVLNLGARSGTYKAAIVEVVPRLQPARWLVKWELEPDDRETRIPGRGRRTLLLGEAELVRRWDGRLAGAVVFASPGRADIPRNIEMSDDEYRAMEPVRIRLQVDRTDGPGRIERSYEIALPFEDIDGPGGVAHARVREIDEWRPSQQG